MRFTTSQTSFKSGRLSPKLFNRVDTRQYKDGASELKGMRVIPEGGVDRIKGTRFVNQEVLNPNINYVKTKTITVNVNGNQLTLLLTIDGFNEIELFVFKYPYTHGTASSSLTLYSSSATYYDPALFSYAVEGNNVVVAHYSGELEPKVIELDPDTPGTVISALGISAILDNINVPMGEFRSDTLTLSNINTANRTIDVTSSDATVAAYLQSRGTLYVEGLGGRTNSGDANWYAFASSNLYDVQSNIANGVRCYYYLDRQGEEAMDYAGISSVNTWVANDWGAGDWPRTVTSHEGRIVFGGSKERPLALWGGSAVEPFHFNRLRFADSGSTVYPPYRGGLMGAGDTLATDAYLFTISSSTDSEITQLSSGSFLFVGTDRREYIATGGDSMLSALNVSIKPQTAIGSYPAINAWADGSVIYMDSSRTKLFMFRFNGSNGSFISEELSLLFSDLLEGDRIAGLEWAAHLKTLLVVTDNKKLYGIYMDGSTESMGFYETLIDDVLSASYVPAREDQSNADSFHRGDHVLLIKEYTANGTPGAKGVFSYEQLFFEKGVTESYIKEGPTSDNAYLFWNDSFDIRRLEYGKFSVNGEDFTSKYRGVSQSGELTFDWLDTYDENTVKTVTIVTSPTGNLFPQAGDFSLDGSNNLTINCRTTSKPYHIDTGFTSNASAGIKALWDLFVTPGTDFDHENQTAVVDQTVTLSADDLFPMDAALPVYTVPFQAMNLDTGDVVTIESLATGNNLNAVIDNASLNGASRIVVGNLPESYPVVATMPVEAGQQWGTAQMGIKNIDTLGLRYYKSYSVEVSKDGINWMPWELADDEGNAKTGRVTKKHNSSPDYDQIIWFRNTEPEPLTIVGLNMRGVSNDG